MEYWLSLRCRKQDQKALVPSVATGRIDGHRRDGEQLASKNSGIQKQNQKMNTIDNTNYGGTFSFQTQTTDTQDENEDASMSDDKNYDGTFNFHTESSDNQDENNRSHHEAFSFHTEESGTQSEGDGSDDDNAIIHDRIQSSDADTLVYQSDDSMSRTEDLHEQYASDSDTDRDFSEPHESAHEPDLQSETNLINSIPYNSSNWYSVKAALQRPWTQELTTTLENAASSLALENPVPGPHLGFCLVKGRPWTAEETLKLLNLVVSTPVAFHWVPREVGRNIAKLETRMLSEPGQLAQDSGIPVECFKDLDAPICRYWLGLLFAEGQRLMSSHLRIFLNRVPGTGRDRPETPPVSLAGGHASNKEEMRNGTGALETSTTCISVSHAASASQEDGSRSGEHLESYEEMMHGDDEKQDMIQKALRKALDWKIAEEDAKIADLRIKKRKRIEEMEEELRSKRARREQLEASF